MSPGVLSRIRSQAARVSDTARHVRLDEASLAVLAEDFRRDAVPASALDPARRWLGDDDTTLAFVLTLDAINFGSGWFPEVVKRPGMSGYFTIATNLEEAFTRDGAFSADDLCAFTGERAARLLGQPRGRGPVDELMDLFARALADLGHFLVEHYDGSFRGPVDDAGGCAERLVELLASMPLYRDVSFYADEEVPFYKRAQITVSDLAGAFAGAGLGAFRDLDRLTLFADNLVPHVFRRAGALVYSEKLASHIDAEKLLPAGCPEEVEIRAVAVHAAERMVAMLAERGCETSARVLDGWLWTRGQHPDVKAAPRHRTRTSYY
ncbi:MAG: hypothetical protein HRU01_30830 [Myxococcales bacterium]|nr:hypothetical protein [Myxococcales bacterium]